ncbi:MAG: YceI family protein [Thermomicrobiales bacterium]
MVAGFEANGTFNRKAFGLAWNQALESGGVLLGAEVQLSLEVQAAEAGS